MDGLDGSRIRSGAGIPDSECLRAKLLNLSSTGKTIIRGFSVNDTQFVPEPLCIEIGILTQLDQNLCLNCIGRFLV